MQESEDQKQEDEEDAVEAAEDTERGQQTGAKEECSIVLLYLKIRE